MKLVKVDNYDQLSAYAALLIKKQIQKKSKSVLGLATGSTPIGTYKELIKFYNNKEISFKNIKTVNLDEYIGIDKNNVQSYNYFMKENLFKHIDINVENINIPNGMENDELVECKRYDEVIKKCGGIDLQILGLGLNGHIGFNEPGIDFALKTHKVKLQKSTIDANKRFFSENEKMPRYAYTMGINAIMQSKKILLLVSGSNKASILRKIIENEPTNKIPATILNNHKDVIIIADKDALGEIDESYFE